MDCDRELLPVPPSACLTSIWGSGVTARDCQERGILNRLKRRLRSLTAGAVCQLTKRKCGRDGQPLGAFYSRTLSDFMEPATMLLIFSIS
jgi:hypothetical protein